MQAFGVSASEAMRIVDKFNEVGNKFAINSSGIGEALQISGSALASANNTMEESIALVTAMNRVVQNPSSVGTALKTVSMYLRATKTDLEDAGESTDGMAETVSKLREKLYALSHGQVDIFDDVKNEYKSTAEIIVEMGKAWETMTDSEHAAALELMGGKRNANALSALITNYKEIEQVIKVASNAEGSAVAENEKYLNSINGLMAQIEASFQSLSTHVLDSSIPKFMLSIVNSFIKLTDSVVKLSGSLPAIIASLTTVLSILQATGTLKNGAGKVNMPTYAHCA